MDLNARQGSFGLVAALFCACLPMLLPAQAQESGGDALGEARLFEQACRRVVEPQSFEPYERTEVQCYFAGRDCEDWSATWQDEDAAERCAVRVYLRQEKVVALTRLYVSDASNRYQLDQHCYRPDGSLAAFEAELLHGSATGMYERRYLDAAGSELQRSRALFDTDTGERIDTGEEDGEILLLSPSLWAAEAEQHMTAAMEEHRSMAGSAAFASNAAREQIAERARQVLAYLKHKNLHALSSFVHPVYGVRFSPEGSVDLDRDPVLLPHEVRNLNTVANDSAWPIITHGDGEVLVEFDFDTYYDHNLYDRDYLHAPQVSYNCAIAGTEEEDNLRAVYEDAIIVEHRFPAFSERQSSAGWASLKLVFTRHVGEWYLRGIVRGSPSHDAS